MTWMKKTLGLAVAVSMCVGCTSASPISSESENPEPVEISAEDRDRYFEFAWTLFNENRQEKTSELISPLSALYALGMAANGASGETRTQMEEALHLDVDQINALSHALLSSNNTGANGQLRLANSMWVRKDSADQLKDSFNQILERDYQAQSFESNFDASAQKEINAWIEEKTGGMIRELNLNLDSSTMMVLLDALAFDAQWAVEYDDQNIASGIFHNADGSESEVTTLHSLESSWIESQGLQGTIKPYEGEDFSLVLLMPKEDKTLDETLENIDPQKLLEDIRLAEKADVQTTFPEFELSQEILLNESLQKMGMVDAFDGQADFSNMMDASLAISEVLQKTRIEVNRTGTKAAAVTSVEIKETAMIVQEEKEIIFDRPFLFILMNGDLPILMGTVQSMDATVESGN